MKIERQVTDNEKIFLCMDFVDKCDVKYPCFPRWELCGKSYIEMSGMVACKNYEMIKRILEEKLSPA